jgi:cell division protein FtsZ
VIAAGFDGGMPKRAKEGAGLRRNQPAPAQSQQETLNAARALSDAKRSEGTKEPVAAGASTTPTSTAPSTSTTPASATAPRPYSFDDDDLDIPDFLK